MPTLGSGACYEGLTPKGACIDTLGSHTGRAVFCESTQGVGLHRFDPLFHFWLVIGFPFAATLTDSSLQTRILIVKL